jgi:hypothetical protein
MALSFENAWSQTVYIAIIWFDSACSPPWQKVGWYVANPGQTVQIYSGNLLDLPNPNWAWFAQAGYADGPCWSGDAGHRYRVAHNNSFDQCLENNDAAMNAEYPFKATQFAQGWNDVNVILLGPGEAGQLNQGFAWPIVQQVPQSVAFSTPTLGPSTVTSSATWVLNSQGFWQFTGSIHESGIIGQNYAFGMFLDGVADAQGNPVSVVHAGSVGPHLPFSNDNDSWNDQGFDQRIVDLWPQIAQASVGWDLSVHYTLGEVLEALAEAIGVGVVAAALAIGGAVFGSDYTCDKTPTVEATPDGRGVDAVWHCYPKK